MLIICASLDCIKIVAKLPTSKQKNNKTQQIQCTLEKTNWIFKNGQRTNMLIYFKRGEFCVLTFYYSMGNSVIKRKFEQ